MALGSRAAFLTKSLGRAACAFGLAGGFMLGAASVTLAEEFPSDQRGSSSFQGSQADQQACHDDVFRLCGDFVPDRERIIACLKFKVKQLSPACHAVFTRDDPPPPPPPKKRKRV